MKTTLAVMAAGLGTRFKGGMKQLAQVGPCGQILTEYSVYDALAAGFDKIVFIIRKDIEKDFREAIGSRFENSADVHYAFQEYDDVPDFAKSIGRSRPWGTGQAVIAAGDIINEPFAVINADDFYGRDSFELIHEHLVNEKCTDGVMKLCMAGFVLENTLSPNGSVTRGVCVRDENGMLASLDEVYEISRSGDGKIYGLKNGVRTEIDGKSLVSMNLWGCPAELIGVLKELFESFLRDGTKDLAKDEFVLPIEINRLIRSGRASAAVLPTSEKWFGMTRSEDLAEVRKDILAMTEQGIYPEKLWQTV